MMSGRTETAPENGCSIKVGIYGDNMGKVGHLYRIFGCRIKWCAINTYYILLLKRDLERQKYDLIVLLDS